MFDIWRLKRKLVKENLEFETNQLAVANSTLGSALEASRRVQEEPDYSMWFQHGQGSDIGTGTSLLSSGFTRYDHYQMLDEAWRQYHTNLFARAVVRNLGKFILGRGPTIKPFSKNEKVMEKWNEFVMDNAWSLREKELVNRVFRDGEVFLRFFVDEKNGKIKTRFIRSQTVRNPPSDSEWNNGEVVSFGVGTNPDDVEEPLTYYICNPIDGTLKEKVDASEILHIKILSDSDMKRGISFLLIALPMLAKYSSWLDDRVVLNKTRSAIALIKTIEGNSGVVTNIRDNQRAETYDSDRNKLKAFRPGTVLTASKGIKYDMLSPKINAADVKDDGRAMLLAVAAGCGLPEMMLTADYSNANYSSSMIAQNPFVREVEDWQDFFAYPYKLTFARIIQANIDFGELPDNEDTGCEIEFPPLICLSNNNVYLINLGVKAVHSKLQGRLYKARSFFKGL